MANESMVRLVPVYSVGNIKASHSSNGILKSKNTSPARDSTDRHRSSGYVVCEPPPRHSVALPKRTAAPVESGAHLGKVHYFGCKHPKHTTRRYGWTGVATGLPADLGPMWTSELSPAHVSVADETQRRSQDPRSELNLATEEGMMELTLARHGPDTPLFMYFRAFLLSLLLCGAFYIQAAAT